MMRKDRRRRDRFDEGNDINPMNYVANMSDAMLILAVGIMLALIIHWNVDVSTTGGDDSDGGMTLNSQGTEQIDKNAAVQFDETDMEEREKPEDTEGGDGMDKLGEVYYDAASGKYYVVKDNAKSKATDDESGDEK